MQASEYYVSGITGRQFELDGESCELINDVERACFPDLNSVATVRIERKSNIPTFKAMGGTCLALGWIF